MRIATDIAQSCAPKAGCGWLAETLAFELLRAAPQHEHIWYHQFNSWINETTDRGPTAPDGRVSMPFRGMPAGEAHAAWAHARATGKLPGDPDIVHAHSFNAPPVGRAKLVFTSYDVSFWVHPEHNTELNRLVCQRGVMDSLTNASGFYFISEFSRREFDRVLGGWLTNSGRPCLVHPLAARHAPPAPDWKKPDGGAWLFVGSLEPRKNVERLLDAYTIYHAHSDVRRPLRLVGGPGWKSEETVRRIAAWKPRGAVEHVGYVSDSDLVEEYRRAFGFVFPSVYEGFGLPVIEAMQQGTPVICGRNSSLPEAAGNAGIYVDPSDASSIAQAMLLLESATGDYAAHSDRCRAHASRFSWKSVAESLLSFYETLLKT